MATDPSFSSLRALPALAAVAAALVTCGNPVGVDRADPRDAYRQLTSSALTTGEPSRFSVDVLRRFALDEAFEDSPLEVLHELSRHASQFSDRDVWFALAEVALIAGDDAGGDQQTELYFASALYAWSYLFDDSLGLAPREYDPRFRLAGDIYNRALGLALDTDGDGELEVEPARRKWTRGTLTLAVNRSNVTFDPAEYSHLLPAGQYRIRGIANRHRTPGIGVALIAARDEDEESDVAREYIEHPPCVVATCVLVPDGGAAALRAGDVRGTLHLVSPIKAPTLEVGDREITVEWDYSTVLAYGLSESKLFDLELPSLFGGIGLKDYTGLYQAQPYERGKIPVVFVHGTASSVARWADMFNDLIADPTVRERYQFWYFTYLSGNPLPLSALKLRKSLIDARARLDPEGSDRALDRMVVIGHSQGGLLARLAVVDDGKRALWDSTFSRPIDELKGDEEMLGFVRELFFFSPVPSVRRVIYIATPHRGSYLADNFIGRFLRGLIEVPETLVTTTVDLVTLNRDILRYDSESEIPTSLSGMRTTDPFLLALAGLPVARDVKQHSIVALRPGASKETGSDGVVEYKSAALEHCDSCCEVSAYHSCQAHPLVINEVRRLLHDHLRVVDAEFAGVSAASARAAVDAVAEPR